LYARTVGDEPAFFRVFHPLADCGQAQRSSTLEDIGSMSLEGG